MGFILIMVGFLVVVTLAIVGCSLAWNGKSVRAFSLRDILKENKKGENK